MPGSFRHISVLLCLFSATLAGRAQWHNTTPDSLFVKGAIAASPDSLLPQTTIQVRLGDVALLAGDSVATTVHKSTSLSGWARSPWGRLQFDTTLPKYADSCRFWMGCDTLGLTLAWAKDTVQWTWKPEERGCFPVATSSSVDAILQDAQRFPFESSRLSLIKSWLEGKCTSPEQVGRLAAAFDDEARRLDIIQSATCSSPSQTYLLEKLFASQHYRSVFLEWAPSPH